MTTTAARMRKTAGPISIGSNSEVAVAPVPVTGSVPCRCTLTADMAV